MKYWFDLMIAALGGFILCKLAHNMLKPTPRELLERALEDEKYSKEIFITLLDKFTPVSEGTIPKYVSQLEEDDLLHLLNEYYRGTNH